MNIIKDIYIIPWNIQYIIFKIVNIFLEKSRTLKYFILSAGTQISFSELLIYLIFHIQSIPLHCCICLNLFFALSRLLWELCLSGILLKVQVPPVAGGGVGGVDGWVENTSLTVSWLWSLVASIDDVISLDGITAYDFVSHLITNNDDHDYDNVDVLNNV